MQAPQRTRKHVAKALGLKEEAVTVNVTQKISTNDANSFRRSSSQTAADASRAVRRYF